MRRHYAIQGIWAPVDPLGMGRGLLYILFLVPLAIVGLLMAKHLGQNGPTSPAVLTIVSQGQANVGGTNLVGAAPVLEAHRATTGSYAGADLASFGTTLIRADSSSYCIQTGSGATTLRLQGPGGSPTAGAC